MKQFIILTLIYFLDLLHIATFITSYSILKRFVKELHAYILYITPE